MPVEQPEPPTNLRLRLRQFTLSDIEGFCHDLEINAELLRHQKLDDFVLDLLGYCQRRPGLIERLTQLVEQAEAERAISPAEGECPYKGLQAYEEADAHLFFGREKLTQELVDHLHKQNFLAVVGASGSGKSSVVKAGVIPQLRKDNQWLIVPPFRPGVAPFEQLALALLPFIDPTLTPTGRLIEQTKLSQAFVEGTLPLSKVVYQIMQNNPGRGRLLLSVDQFEELFTHHQDKQSQEQWLAFMTEPLHQPHNQLTLLLTLRGDFYNSAIQYLPLKPWLETSQKIVTALTPAELEEAITRPAAQAWQFQDGLVATILEDVAQEPGGLPFLSQALLKTWEKRQGRQLTLAGYLASGGVKEAISQTAEQVYNQFTPPAQEVVRGVLLRLTQLGEGREDTRRRLTRPELAGLPYPPELMQEVLDKLTAPQVRLLTQDQEVLEVAHEALIRGWPLLRQWLDEDREGLRLHRQLTEAAGEWEKLGRDKSLLWRGARLANALETEFDKWGLTESEYHFLDASIYEEEGQNRRTQLTILGLAILVIVAFMTAGLATYFYKQANDQGNISLSLALASASEVIGDKDVMKSLLLSLEAMQISEANLAFTALNERVSYVPKLFLTLQHGYMVTSAEWNADKSNILTISPDGTAKVWDEQSGQLILALNHGGFVTSAEWNGDESRILTSSDNGMAKVWNGQTGDLLFALQHEDGVWSAKWNGDESRILTISSDGTAKVWNGQTGDLLFALQHEDGVTSAGWNRNESRILTSSNDGTAKVWDGQSGEFLFALQHEDGVWSAKWNGDESRILTSSEDGTAKVWNGQSGLLLFTLQHQRGVTSAGWNGDESRILTSSEDGTAKVWNGQSGVLLFNLQHQREINSAEWNGDESRILTSSDDGTAKVWDVQSGQLILVLNHGGLVNSAKWNRIESRILTSSGNGTAKVWDGQSGELLFTLQHEGWVKSAEWNGNESRILTSSFDGTAKVWGGDTGRVLFTLLHEGWVNSAEWNGDESRILTSSDDGTAKVWDVQSRAHLFSLQHDDRVWLAEWNEDETQIMTISYDNKANVWDEQTGELLFTLQHEGYVNSAEWNEDESHILTNSADGTAKVWDGQSGTLLFTLQHEGIITSDEWNGDESRILTSSSEGTAKVWNGQSGALLFTLQHEGAVYLAKWNGDESRILTRSGDTVKVWGGSSWELLLTLLHEGWVNSAEWNGDESRILTSSNDGTAKVWDGQSGTHLFTLNHGGMVNSAKWNRNETRILTASSDRTAKVWDGQSGAHLFTLSHEDRVTSSEWSPAETQILTIDWNGVARLWEAETGELLLIIEGDGSEIINTKWSETDSRLWVITKNGLVQTYYTNPQELITEGCSRVTRNLTWEEWQTYLPGRPYRQTCPNLPVHPSVPESERP